MSRADDLQAAWERGESGPLIRAWPVLLAVVRAAQMQCEIHPSETVPHLFRALAAFEEGER